MNITLYCLITVIQYDDQVYKQELVSHYLLLIQCMTLCIFTISCSVVSHFRLDQTLLSNDCDVVRVKKITDVV